MDFFKKIDYKNFENALCQLKEFMPQFQLIHVSNFTFDIPAAEFYQKASDTLGVVQPIDENKETGELTGNRWIDITFDPAEPNKYRSSNTRQPFHTDDSYIEIEGAEGRVTFFYCDSQANLGGATTFVKPMDIINALEFDEEYELLNDLRTIPIRFEKGGSVKIRPILAEDEIGTIWTWNWHCVDTQNNTEKALEVAKKFHEFLENRVLMSGLFNGVELKAGEAVFFHDHRLLHGRNAFFTKELGGRKLIKGAFVLN